MKNDDKHKDKAAKAAPVVAIVCSVCGQGGDLSGAAGVARWHGACEKSRPDVIAKVKARA